METRLYSRTEKPISRKGGNINDGNLKKEGQFGQYLYEIGHTESFNGFSGTAEFDSFPLRQMFVNKHKRLPSEWDTGYFTDKYIHKYISENKKCIIATHYKIDGISISKSILYFGGKENVYVYIYDRSYYQQEKDKYGVAILFCDKTPRVNKIINLFKKNVVPVIAKETGYINILIKSQSGYRLESKEIKCPDIDFALNYNSDFIDISKLVVERLSKNNSKGLVLFHGPPGTGKTTYIKYLCNNIKKKIIYIPPNLTESISDPALIKFFLEHSNSILVIEDAENILMKRSKGSSQSVANILNLTDGLLSDCTNIQVVATFNTEILNIDEALLRKGRLIAKYEFKELEEDRAVRLANKLKVKMGGKDTLANIYNAEETSFAQKTSKIGFK